MVRWLRWHCPPDTGFEIRALAVWGRARYLSVTEAPHNTNFHTWMGKKQFCFFQTAETGNRIPDSGVKGSGANHYPRAPAQQMYNIVYNATLSVNRVINWASLVKSLINGLGFGLAYTEQFVANELYFITSWKQRLCDQYIQQWFGIISQRSSCMLYKDLHV